ncbi:MAG: endolytic transglycosylase MltG, partial [Sphingomonadales bacterium]
EYEKIAGVYINRLRKGMLLQADPTVVFARGKAGRVWAKDLTIQNPYNTYIHPGLPPGPICIPNLQSIEAVLNYKQHDFLYFCAKADFSGYHDFATNLADHNRNAAAFHRAMDERGIK